MLTRAVLILMCLSLASAAQTSKAGAQSAAPKKAPAAAPAKTEPTAILHTTAGDLKCTLFPDKAPKTVANFIGLAKGTKAWKDPGSGSTMHKPLYDGVIFHRTIPNFMIQSGDPMGTGSSEVGFNVDDELHSDLLFDQPGRLAMANLGSPNTNSSQFFITEKEVPFLNPCLDPQGCMGGRRAPNTGYTIFGQCDADSVELVKKIARMPCTGGVTCDANNSRPLNPVKIKHVEILGVGAKPAAKKAASAAPKKSAPPKN
jgi:peptidyl-prolyl cis-trans isomerase A (cyclophilin A)